MKTKLFPPPVAPYDAAEHLERMKEQEESQIDYYPWKPRVLATIAGGCVWGIVFVLILCVWISGNDSFGDIVAAFSLGFIIPVIFSIPFLWK